jgi:hypothetical protein
MTYHTFITAANFIIWPICLLIWFKVFAQRKRQRREQERKLADAVQLAADPNALLDSDIWYIGQNCTNLWPGDMFTPNEVIVRNHYPKECGCLVTRRIDGSLPPVVDKKKDEELHRKLLFQGVDEFTKQVAEEGIDPPGIDNLIMEVDKERWKAEIA